MFKKISRKTFLLSCIFLLSTFMLVQLSWGCDDHDKWGCDHHDKWSCNDHGKHCNPPKIQIVDVEVDPSTGFITLTIYGKNFDNGARPFVTLGGMYDLIVDPNYENHRIKATSQEKIDYGDYKLVVSTGHGFKCKDKYCTHHGSKCKDKYCTGHGCECKDEYCLTIPGPPGPPGPPGTIGSQIVTVETLDVGGHISGTAPCPSGYTLTGGGFDTIPGVTIVVSKPVKDGTGDGWFVSGVLTTIETARLTVYAICVQIK